MIESAGSQDDSSARTDPLRGAVTFEHRSGHRSVCVGEQLGHRCVEPQRNTTLPHREPKPCGQRLPDRGHPLVESPRLDHSPNQLQQHTLTGPGLPDPVEGPKFLGAQPDSPGRKRERLEHRLFVRAQFAQIDGRHVDRAAEFGAPRQFRVIVGVAGFPDEFKPARQLFEKLEHFRCRLDVLPDARLADQAVGDLEQIVDHAFGIRGVALPALRGRSGYPDAAARQGGGTAEIGGLFDHQRVEPGRVRGQGGRHAAAARPDDQHVDDVIQAVHLHIRHVGTAVLMANPAISARPACSSAAPSDRPRGFQRGESRYPRADFVRGATALVEYERVRPVIELGEPAGVDDLQETMVPRRVEGLQVTLATRRTPWPPR